MAVRKFGPFESAMEKLWDRYCRYSGCQLSAEFVALDLHELYTGTLLENGLAEGRWDIAHINTDWVYGGFEAGAFEDLQPYIRQSPPSGFPEAWSSSLLELQQFGEQVAGLPFHNGPECLIYRKDLFEDPEEKRRYAERYGQDLRVPANWEEFRQVARFFHRPEQQLYGTVFAGFPDGHNTVFDFCLQLWSRGRELVNAEGDIDLDSAEAVEALDYYRTLMEDQQAVHPGSAGYDSVQAGMAFGRGEVAMMINWFGFASICEVDPLSVLKGKVAVSGLPAKEGNTPVSLNVYWLYTIGSGSRHKQVAYDFIRFAVNAENDKLLTLEGGIGCRMSSWKDEDINRIIPYYRQLEQLHEGAASLPQKKNWVQIAAIIDRLVLDALHTSLPTEQLIKNANADIQLLNR